MTTNEILALRRAELRLMEMGARMEQLLRSPSEFSLYELRKEFNIEVKTTRAIRGKVQRCGCDDNRSGCGVNFITTIKWVRGVSRKVGNPDTGAETIMGLREAKELVESWVGLSTFEIPLDWNLAAWPLPVGFEVIG